MNLDHLRDPAGRRYVRLFLSFTVGVSVALAPFLGSFGVPGFRSLYSLLPVDVREIALVVSAALSGIVALYVTTLWEKSRSARLRTWFRRWTWLAIGSLVLFGTASLTMVVPVVSNATDTTVRFTVGPFSRSYRAPCTERVDDSRCIELLTFNPSRVRAQWGAGNVILGQAIVLGSYLGLIGAIGAAVGAASGLRKKPARAARSNKRSKADRRV